MARSYPISQTITSQRSSCAIPVRRPRFILTFVQPVVKKLIKATGAENYNILQNNGRIAHQEVDHVHFHMIPKPNKEEGMGISWPQQKTDMDKLKGLFEDIKSKM